MNRSHPHLNIITIWTAKITENIKRRMINWIQFYIVSLVAATSAATMVSHQIQKRRSRSPFADKRIINIFVTCFRVPRQMNADEEEILSDLTCSLRGQCSRQVLIFKWHWYFPAFTRIKIFEMWIYELKKIYILCADSYFWIKFRDIYDQSFYKRKQIVFVLNF